MPPRARSKVKIKNFLLMKRNFTSEGCWLWLGAVAKTNGYGRTGYKNEDWQVHRLAFMLFRPDEFSENLPVLHKNECKDRRCFNPDHLYQGTQFQNMQDKKEAGTHHNTAKKFCLRDHEFTPENTYLRRNGGRSCKECKKIRDAYYIPSKALSNTTNKTT